MLLGRWWMEISSVVERNYNAPNELNKTVDHIGKLIA